MAQTILVIDDDASVRGVLRTFFEKRGYLVVEANDGDAGLALIEKADVVLLDQMMPGKGGLDVIKELRGRGDAVPVLMLTADSNPETAVVALEAGANDHVMKPFSLQVLLARVRRFLPPEPEGVELEPEIVSVDDVVDPTTESVVVVPFAVPVAPPDEDADSIHDGAGAVVVDAFAAVADAPHLAARSSSVPPRPSSSTPPARTSSGSTPPTTSTSTSTTSTSSSSTAASTAASTSTWVGRLKSLSNRLLGDDDAPMLKAGSLIAGRYRLDAPIGSGKMGTVWRARHTELDIDVALKVMHKDAPPVQPGETARESFRREALMLARVRHRHVVRAYDAGVDASGHAWLVMELLSGESARVAMARGITVQRACGVVADVCAGLAACHREGVVHRDVKAVNVFLADDDPDEPRVTKLVDFGAACAVDDVRQHELLVGTPTHMAPERFVDARATAQSDVYAAGVLLHHLVTGALPFVAKDVDTLAHLHQTAAPPLPSQARPDLLAGVDDAVARLMRKNPAERPTAREAAVLLRSIARAAPRKR
jgi:CheY-like chemotaxis protein